MGGQRVLRQIQFGKETVHGTAVAADTRALCEVTLPATDREVVVPGMGLGLRVPHLLDAAFVKRILAEGVQLGTPEGLYYQLVPWLLSGCLKGNITPVEQTGSQNDMLWTFAEALTGSETLDSVTLEVGDDARAYEIAYGMISELEFTGNADTGEVTVSAQIFGDKIVSTSFTAAIGMPTPTFVIGSLFRLYIDDAWSELGDTEFTQTLFDWRLKITGGGHPKLRGSSSRLFGAHGQGEVVVELELGLERNAATTTEEGYFLADTTTSRFVRLAIDSGVQIGTGDNHQLTFDIAGVWSKWAPMSKDQDGNNLDVVTLMNGYDDTGSRAFGANVTTNVAAL